MTTMLQTLGLGILLGLGAGCVDAPTYLYPLDLTELEFTFFRLEAGVYPHDDLLIDPSNPFREFAIGEETKWELVDGAGPVAVYYAWGTLLAREPRGEYQFYTATALRDIYLLELADPRDLWAVREMAIAGYQAILDYFPDSVTYDAAGRFGFPLAPLAYDGIVGLGGTVDGWVKVTLEDGTVAVIRAPTIVVQEPQP